MDERAQNRESEKMLAGTNATSTVCSRAAIIDGFEEHRQAAG